MKKFKLAIGIALAVVWGAIFLVMPAHAFVNDGSSNVNHNGSMESKSIGNGEARGVANFTMSFSGSGTTKGDFDHGGMMQNIFGGQNKEATPYYYGNQAK